MKRGVPNEVHTDRSNGLWANKIYLIIYSSSHLHHLQHRQHNQHSPQHKIHHHTNLNPINRHQNRNPLPLLHQQRQRFTPAVVLGVLRMERTIATAITTIRVIYHHHEPKRLQHSQWILVIMLLILLPVDRGLSMRMKMV